jgi:glucokinase
MILAGDIGGTNSRLAIFDAQLNQVAEAAVKNAGRASLGDVVGEFLTKHRDAAIDRACFGVAGPVADGKVTLTNLMWQLDEQSLARELAIAKVALINDLVAHAEGIEVLKPEHVITIKAGEPVPRGSRAVIAAGTGLGEAGLVWDPDVNGYRAFASEGGHSDFSPRTDQDVALMKFVQKQRGTATWERVLSGPGLKRIYEFLGGGDDLSPEQITRAARDQSNRAAVAALDLFVRYYGIEAGNLALKFLAGGGVYISGGIADDLIDQLKSPLFLDAFHDHGPDKLRAVLAKMPIHVVIFEMCALYGAANYARRL